jgi:peptide/nickel transport system substrate-binding protein
MDTSDIENLPKPQIVAAVRSDSALTRARNMRPFEHLERLMRRFSPAERLLLYLLSILLGLSVVGLLVSVNSAISTEVPARGGSFVEGETGSARFINPILAISDPDEDLSQLIYSGLMRALPNGTYVPDLAESYSVSPDGTTYTFTLRENLTFHDGAPVSSADVLYTVALAQNPDIKSSQRADWEGVEVSAPDASTVIFTLPHAYAPFIEDTTLGILPQHLWQNVQSDSFPFSPLNTHPIGTGPYKVAQVKTDAAGAPIRYDLVPFDNFALHGGYLSRVSFAFYPNQEALVRAFASGQVDAVAGVTPSVLEKFVREDTSVLVTPLPRVFGIFFNQNHNAVLADASVRQALEEALDKQGIVNEALHSYGSVLNSPIPPGVLGSAKPAIVLPTGGNTAHGSSTTSFSTDAAIATLKKAGWSVASSTGIWTKNIPKSGTTPASKQEVSFKLATANEPELVTTANLVAEQWRAIGIDVDVQVYPISDFNNTVLRPRNYDAILFGEVVSRSGDLFAFWHSSQRNDPGLNLSLYANSKADALLSKARTSSSKEERDDLYSQFIEIVQKDRPAIFLYSPDFIYIVPTKIRDIQLGALSSAAERFLNIYQWYSDTERVWEFFAADTSSADPSIHQ